LSANIKHKLERRHQNVATNLQNRSSANSLKQVMDACTYLRDHRHSLKHSVGDLIHEPIVAKTCPRDNPTLWNTIPSDTSVFILGSAYATVIGSSTSSLSFFNLTAQQKNRLALKRRRAGEG
jgi:hypothetical protein